MITPAKRWLRRWLDTLWENLSNNASRNCPHTRNPGLSWDTGRERQSVWRLWSCDGRSKRGTRSRVLNRSLLLLISNGASVCGWRQVCWLCEHLPSYVCPHHYLFSGLVDWWMLLCERSSVRTHVMSRICSATTASFLSLFGFGLRQFMLCRVQQSANRSRHKSVGMHTSDVGQMWSLSYNLGMVWHRIGVL